MTTSDVDRLYGLITELKGEVTAYRNDLNGRLNALEVAQAHSAGHQHGRGDVGRMLIAVAAVAASIGSIVGVIATLV